MGRKGNGTHFGNSFIGVILYITYNDAPSGIYSGQVIDVIKFMNTELKANVRLLAFISIRGFFKNRKKIKSELPNALVLPMFPGVQRWRKNVLLLKVVNYLWRPEKIIGRSVLATQLALACKSKKNKIVYDGRGAIAAEWKEYKVVSNVGLVSGISDLEKDSILNSDFRIAVSNALINYWKEEYHYRSKDHVVIPCTLNQVFEKQEISETAIQESRNKLGLEKDDLVFVYSGSVAGWQSFDILYHFIQPILKCNSNAKILFLSDKDKNIARLETEFAGQVICKRILPQEVPQYLIAGDYGLLIRETSITNKVASPVKFAEYLACGLRVVISTDLGDYTDFVLEHKCGYIHADKFLNDVARPSLQEKNSTKDLSIKYFTKKNNKSQYKELIYS